MTRTLFIQGGEELDSSRVKACAKTMLLLHGLRADVDLMKTFDEVCVNDVIEQPVLFEKVKEASEIYIDVTLTPTIGRLGFYENAPALINDMLYFLNREKRTSKSVYLLRDYHSIKWNDLKPELIDQVFRKNELYVMDSNNLKWDQVDIDKLLEFELDYISPVPVLPGKQRSKKSKR